MSYNLDQLAGKLYSEGPTQTLFHYTSLQAIEQIVPTAKLRASEVHYLNDASEIQLATEVYKRSLAKVANAEIETSEIRRQLLGWLDERVANGYWLFVVCFTEQGDLLSQWRGYTPHGQGVSLGFETDHLLARAEEQGFRFGKCIYDPHKQQALADHAMQHVVTHAVQHGATNPSLAHPTQSYYPAFAECEVALLRIAALIKHHAFEAEQEWRAVSEPLADLRDRRLTFRAGRSTMVPFLHFCLRANDSTSIGVSRAVHGPTPHQNLAVAALSSFLARHNSSEARRTVRPSAVSYRET